VFLLTDGLANCGETTTQGIVELMKSKRAEGVRVHTFGFGADHAADMLTELAKQGQGEYMFIEDDKLGDSFAEALGGLASVVAQMVTLTVSNSTDGEVPTFTTQLPVKKEGGSVEVDIDDMYSEERRDILVSCHAGATATLKYFCIQSCKFVSIECTCSPTNLSDEDAELMAAARARVVTAAALVAANRLAAAGKLAEARKELVDAQCAVDNADPEFKEDLLTCLSHLGTDSEYQKKGSKMMQWKAGGHGKQRSRGAECSYTNSVQRRMKAAYAATS
jgi:hypothetical protein